MGFDGVTTQDGNLDITDMITEQYISDKLDGLL